MAGNMMHNATCLLETDNTDVFTNSYGVMQWEINMLHIVMGVGHNPAYLRDCRR